MTRKDYILIADELKLLYNNCTLSDTDGVDGFSAACGAVASALKRDNPKFDMNKFMEYITNG